MMKRFVWALLVGLTVAFPASARIEERQNQDGTAENVGGRGAVGNCIGGQVMSSEVTLNSAVVTRFIPSPITNAYLKDAWLHRSPAVALNVTPQVIIFPAGQTTTAVRFVNRSAGLATNALLYVDGTISGATVRRLSTATQAGGDLTSHAPTEKYQTFALVTQNSAATAGSAMVFLQICPR